MRIDRTTRESAADEDHFILQMDSIQPDCDASNQAHKSLYEKGLDATSISNRLRRGVSILDVSDDLLLAIYDTAQPGGVNNAAF